MSVARQRQRDNIVQKQVVWGREFKGAAFLPTPAKIVFRDFDVGETYTVKVRTAGRVSPVFLRIALSACSLSFFPCMGIVFGIAADFLHSSR